VPAGGATGAFLSGPGAFLSGPGAFLPGALSGAFLSGAFLSGAGALFSCCCIAGGALGGFGGAGAAGGAGRCGASAGGAVGRGGGGGGAGWGGGAAAGGAGRGGGAAGGAGRGGGAAGGAAFGGAAFGASFGGCLDFPSGPTSSLAWAITIGAVCAWDGRLPNCIAVRVVVASSTRRRFFMTMWVPGKILATRSGNQRISIRPDCGGLQRWTCFYF
jgi:hypothetical protein